LRRSDNDADFSINGNDGKIKEIEEITNSKAEHYIKVNDGYDKEEIKNNLNTIDFDFVSSVNGGVSWIGRNDILGKWCEFKNNEK